MSAPTGWQPIETAPRNRVVLVAYKNSLGNWRRVRACYYDKGQLQTADHMEPPDCDEEGYAHPGWYEECETAEYIQQTDEPPVLWHELPALAEKYPEPVTSLASLDWPAP